MLDLFNSYVSLTLLKTIFSLLFSLFQLGYFLLTCKNPPKIKASALLIAVEGMSYCILEA